MACAADKTAPSEAGAYSGRTAWVRNLETPLRTFLRTETGSAAVLLAGVVAALVWANLDVVSYVHVWEKTTLSIHIGDTGLSNDLRYWVNAGLMTLFFFVIGLEARREFDLGELRDRRRLQIPLAAGIGGMLIPVAIFLALNVGRSSAHGWGVAMSTDTAFAFGLLALVGSRGPFRLRAFVLTFSGRRRRDRARRDRDRVRDGRRRIGTRRGAGDLRFDHRRQAVGIRIGALYAILGVATWIVLSRSGVDPIVVGLAMGLLTYAAPASRSDLERATNLFRLFREQPTPELARSAQAGVATAISPNDRLQQKFHPWTSYVIVPLFALANAGIAIDGGFLGRAFTSPITLGILIGYVRRQAGRRRRRILARHEAEPRSRATARRLGRARRGRRDRGDRLHRRVPDRGSRLQGRPARRGEGRASSAPHSLRPSLVRGLSFRATAELPRRRRLRALLGASQSRSSTSQCRSIPSATTSAARRMRRSRSSSTATSSVRTAVRPSPSSASSCRTSATSATSGGTSR